MLNKISSALNSLISMIKTKDDNHNQVYDALISKLWKTKGVRFTADERLKDKHNLSTVALAMLSLYLIGIASASMINFSGFVDKYGDHIPLFTLFISIFILVISLIENSKNYLIQASKMHQCALEIQALYHTLDLAMVADKDDYDFRSALLQDYNSILLRYPNHDERNYNIFKARNYREKEFKIGPFEWIYSQMLASRILLCWYWVLDYWLYPTFIFGPPVMFFYLVKI